MDSDESIADRDAVEPYITNPGRKVINKRGLLFAGLGKHLPKKLWIDGAPVVTPNAGPSADLATAVEQRGLGSGGALILQVIGGVHASHQSENQYACSTVVSAGDDSVLKVGGEKCCGPVKICEFRCWRLLK